MIKTWTLQRIKRKQFQVQIRVFLHQGLKNPADYKYKQQDFILHTQTEGIPRRVDKQLNWWEKRTWKVKRNNSNGGGSELWGLICEDNANNKSVIRVECFGSLFHAYNNKIVTKKPVTI
jgi:hypothetical protein